MQEQPAAAIAEADFARLAETFDLDLQSLDADDAKTFQATKRVVIRALEQGRLTIGTDGLPALKPHDGSETLMFKAPTGSTRLAATKGRDPNDKAMHALAHITGVTHARLAALAQRDLKVCEALLMLAFA
jgi:hypothetical protein